MFDIVISISCFLVSILMAIYVAYSKNLKIIASIDHEKVRPENKNKIAYIFSICLVLGTIFIISSGLLHDYNFYLSIFLFVVGFAILVLFYIIFLKLNKWFI